MANGANTKTHSTNAPACPNNEEAHVDHEHDQYLQSCSVYSLYT